MINLKCLIVGHKWSSYHGYYDEPNFGAYCLRPHCIKKTETYEQWAERNKVQ